MDVFTDVDEELAVALAAAAGVAIENARLHQHMAALTLLEDRERIAHDLHDDVIQRVFAAGLSLQSAAQMSTQRVVRERLEQIVADLDVTIRQVRNTIFQLSHRAFDESSVRADIITVCERGHPLAGLRPAVPDPRLGRQFGVEHDCRPSDPARCARCSPTSSGMPTRRVRRLRFRDRWTVDPRGHGRRHRHAGRRPSPEGTGLTNLLRRAVSLDGEFDSRPVPGGGTRLMWSVPLGHGVSDSRQAGL